MARLGPSLRSRVRVLILASSAVFLSSGCLVKRMALNSVGDMVAAGNSGYMTDDDPEFVGQAMPFGLKLMESLIAAAPNHKTLLLGAAAGFTQYAYAYVLLEADVAGVDDYRRYRELRHRARRLFLRGRDYGFQGLEARHRGFREWFEADPDAVLAEMKEDDAPFLYWTGAAWSMGPRQTQQLDGAAHPPPHPRITVPVPLTSAGPHSASHREASRTTGDP